MINKYEIAISALEDIINPLPDKKGWSRGDLLRYARTLRVAGPHNTGMSHWILFRLHQDSTNTLVISGHHQDDRRLLIEAERHLPYNDALMIVGGITEKGNDYLISQYVKQFGLLKRVYVDPAAQYFRRRGIKRFFNDLADFCTDDVIFYLLS